MAASGGPAVSARRRLEVVAALLGLCALAAALGRPAPVASQAPDVLINIRPTPSQKVKIIVPDFAVSGGADPQGLGRQLAQVAAADLRFSALFDPLSGIPGPAPGDPAAVRRAWAEATAAGAQAALQGLLTLRGGRIEAEMRLFDLTGSEPRQVGSKRFEQPAPAARRLAHKMADEVVYLFTGEHGVADTKIAYVAVRGRVKEVAMVDADGAGATPLTSTGSINLSPSWSPDARSIAYTSFFGSGYPYLYRLFPFERRPLQTLAGFLGINSSPAWSPDGRQVAMTLTKDGNPEIYVLTLATGAFRRLTTWTGIDTEPSWSPTGREIAFTSDRGGAAQIYVMDAEGGNLRRVSRAGGFNTQPRWSPRGDVIAYTSRQGNHDIWAVAPDGSDARRLTAGPGDSESASWAPNGRHLVFHSSRGGRTQLYTMLADGTEVQPLTREAGEARSPAWSPRLP
jgi:TolB protein